MAQDVDIIDACLEAVMALYRRMQGYFSGVGKAVQTRIRGPLRPATVTAAVLFFVLAIAQLARFVLGLKVVANGVPIPTWPSIIAFVVFAVMATFLWRERRC